MSFEEGGTRIDDLKLIISRVAYASGLFDQDGIQVIFFLRSSFFARSIHSRYLPSRSDSWILKFKETILLPKVLLYNLSRKSSSPDWRLSEQNWGTRSSNLSSWVLRGGDSYRSLFSLSLWLMVYLCGFFFILFSVRLCWSEAIFFWR